MNEKNTSHSSITLTGDSLTIQDLVAVARSQARVAPLQPSDRAVESWQWVKQVSGGGLHCGNGAHFIGLFLHGHANRRALPRLTMDKEMATMRLGNDATQV